MINKSCVLQSRRHCRWNRTIKGNC